MIQPSYTRAWSQISSYLLIRFRAVRWANVVVLIGFVGLFFGLLTFAHEVTGQFRPTVDIDLSPWALPRYALYSLSRGLAAFALSLGFTLIYGYWAAKDQAAGRVLVPLLDIMQSIPVLGFMPGLVLALVALFPSSNLGLELASILMIFTGQVWNMTFSFYHSLRTVPQDLNEASEVYHFGWWQRFRQVELPSSMIGLVWNGMMSMAGGWFFLMVTESFILGDKDFRLPGIGSYMNVAIHEGNVSAMIYAITAMIIMIVVVDQLFWRPVVVWAQRFRVEESTSEENVSSWFWELLRRSNLVALAVGVVRRVMRRFQARPKRVAIRLPVKPSASSGRTVSLVMLALIVLALLGGAWALIQILHHLSFGDWGRVLGAGGITLGRVIASTAIGTLWAVPAGLAIGLNPRLSRMIQPVVQIAASFPAPMLFPLVVGGLSAAGVPLGWGSILLMLMGTQWYILFNVIAGATAVPSDLKEAAQTYHLSRWRRFRTLYLPVIMPYLVTGWVTAAGGAWNASIVSEYVIYKGEGLTAWGLGSTISQAAENADLPLLTASVVVMALIVVVINRTVWQRLYHLTERRFSLTK
ncbi:MAG: ABC transporter permease subunit [Dehalococcoidia bacterium]|nr:ABC transporter permease subunit [Dehalococcoidia bacterium]